MKDDLIFIVQECICIDFLINAIMTSNIYKHLNFFSNLKKENLKNIKVICNLYKRTYNDDLLIKDTPSIKLDRNPQNNLNTLLEYSLNLLTRVDVLKKQYSNSCYNKLFQGLYNSYFDLISYIHCFCPLSSNNSFNLKSEKSDILSLNSNNHFSTFFNILSSPTLDFSNKENKIELGYSNYSFDLWLLLHKEDYFAVVPNQKEYEDEIRRVYGLPAEESIKRGRKVERILEQIEWPDIKTAIERAEKIAIDNEGRQENITAGNNIYYDNPDTQMHVLLKFLFKKVGVNIETLG